MPVELILSQIAAYVAPTLGGILVGIVGKTIVEPTLAPVTEPVKKLITKLPKQRRNDRVLRDQLETVLDDHAEQASGDDVEAYARRLAYGMLQGKGIASNRVLREQVAAAALLMPIADASRITNALCHDLNWPLDEKAQLAQILYDLRQQLRHDPGWGPIIAQLDQQETLVKLANMERLELQQTSYIRQLLLHFGAWPDEDAGRALQRYTTYVAERFNEVSFLLIEEKTSHIKHKTTADLDAVYVPLRVYDPEAMQLLDWLRLLCDDGDTQRRVAHAPDWAEIGAALLAEDNRDLLQHILRGDRDLVRMLQQLSEEKSQPGKLARRIWQVIGDETQRGRVVATLDLRDRMMSIDEVVATQPVFLLRGKPGTGKTTLLKRLAVAFAGGQAEEILGWQDDWLLPILVPLRNFGKFLKRKDTEYINPGPRALREFIELYYKDHELKLPPEFIRSWLDAGNCLVMLDGLDEVSDRTLRITVAEYVTQFIQHYGRLNNRFALSSRPQGYADARDALPDPVVCEVQDMTPESRDLLVRKVLAQYAAPEEVAGLEDETENLISDIAKRRRIEDLSYNPLFCTTLVLVYKFGGAVLPDRRVDVYQAVVRLMLGFWDTQRSHRERVADSQELVKFDGTGREFATPAEATESRQRALLHVADWMAGQNLVEVEEAGVAAELADYFVRVQGAPEDDVSRWVQGYLQTVSERSGLFISPDPGWFAFAHKLFLEYLAATALVGKTDRHLHQKVLDHAGDSWWHEIILLAVAHEQLSPDRRVELLGILLEEGHVILAGECAVDARARLAEPMRRQVIAALSTQMTDIALEPTARYAAAEQWDALHGPPADINRWVKCVACGDGKRDLYVGRYPVTNAQYALFVAAGGYAEPAYWNGPESDDWRWRLEIHPGYRGESQVTVPQYWRDARFGKERHSYPVVGVSWYEAQAYCRWLTDLLQRVRDKDETVTDAQRKLVADLLATDVVEVKLPASAEWICFAGGEQHNRYPWDKPLQRTRMDDTATITQRANVRESSIQGTTPVAMYPDGEGARFPLMDLSGNVWEWMRETRLRGGSFAYDQFDARVADVLRDLPGISHASLGFRVCAPSF